MFGFLHEVHGRKDLLMNLKTVIKENYLVIISDNLLHFKLKILKSELNSVFENSYFFRVQKLVKDYKILYCFNPIMMKVIKHTEEQTNFLQLQLTIQKIN